MDNEEGNGRLERDERQRPLVVQVQRRRGHGWVRGLKNKQLADPAELERQVFLAEWGPILALPVDSSRSRIRPTIDEDGQVEWGAFGTVDFERLYGPFDKARYKIDRLQAALRDAVIMLEMVAAKLPGTVVSSLMAELRSEAIGLEDIDDMNQYFFAQRYLRVRSIKDQIRELRELRVRRQAQAAALEG